LLTAQEEPPPVPREPHWPTLITKEEFHVITRKAGAERLRKARSMLKNQLEQFRDLKFHLDDGTISGNIPAEVLVFSSIFPTSDYSFSFVITSLGNGRKQAV